MMAAEALAGHPRERAARELDLLLGAHGLTRDAVAEFLYPPGGCSSATWPRMRRAAAATPWCRRWGRGFRQRGCCCSSESPWT